MQNVPRKSREGSWKKTFSFASGILILFISCAPPDIRVATFNIRWSNQVDAENGWEFRRETAFKTIREMDPDFLGLQEVMPDQLEDLSSEFGDEYQIFSATFAHNQSLVILVRNDTKVLSADSDSYMSAYGLFSVTTHQIRFATIHAPGTRESLERARAFLPSEGTILVGDFNALPGPNPWREPLQDVFTHDGRFRDVYAAIIPEGYREPSGCGWGECQWSEVDRRIDWILVTSDFTPVAADILQRRTQLGRNVSDHWPVLGVVR